MTGIEPNAELEPTCSLRDAARLWTQASGQLIAEGTIRRYLTAGEVLGATKDDRGRWRIPTRWMDSEYERVAAATTPIEATIDNDMLSLMVQNLYEITGYCNRAVEVHEHAQALAQQAHDQHIELISHQLDTSQAEAAKIAAQLDDAVGELNDVRHLLHQSELDLARHETARDLHRELEPEIRNLAAQIEALEATVQIQHHLMAALTERKRWWRTSRASKT